MPEHRINNFLYLRKLKAFTLLEVLIALSITAIGLIPLLHLLVTSISVMDSAGCLSQASLIGNAKLAEVAGMGCPHVGTDSGTINYEGSDIIFKWQVIVADAHIKEFEGIDLRDLRKVSVDVIWNEGQKQKQISLSTYVTTDQMTIVNTLRENSS